MKNGFFIILSLVFMLGACGSPKVHENIDPIFAEDSIHLLNVLDKELKKGVGLSEEASRLIAHYIGKYESREIRPLQEMTTEERKLFGMVENAANVAELTTGLPSEVEMYESFKGWSYEILEYGNIQQKN